jgi:hypothetical protein
VRSTVLINDHLIYIHIRRRVRLLRVDLQWFDARTTGTHPAVKPATTRHLLSPCNLSCLYYGVTASIHLIDSFGLGGPILGARHNQAQLLLNDTNDLAEFVRYSSVYNMLCSVCTTKRGDIYCTEYVFHDFRRPPFHPYHVKQMPSSFAPYTSPAAYRVHVMSQKPINLRWQAVLVLLLVRFLFRR